MSIQDLVSKSKVQIQQYLAEYNLSEKSLLSDIKKVILHCTITNLIEEFKPKEIILLIDLKWNCDPEIASVIGEKKCQKVLSYLTNNLRKIFKQRFLNLSVMPNENNLSGEILEMLAKHKTFNFNKLIDFLSHNSLSGLKKNIKEDLSIKQKIFYNFQ